MLPLIGAGLFVRTLLNLQSSKLGFNPDHTLLFEIDLPRTEYPAPRRVPAYHQIEERLASIPGVRSASLSQHALIAEGLHTTGIRITGQPGPGHGNDNIAANQVGAFFSETLNIPIIYGRSFNTHDTNRSPNVAVINERFAQHFSPNVNPVGKTFDNGDNKRVEIVGVCANTKYSDLRIDPPPTFYLELFTVRRCSCDDLRGESCRFAR